MNELRLGILAEDATDAATIEVIAKRVCGDVGVTCRGGGGCSMLERKAEAWMRLLADTCDAIVLVRDRDRHDLTKLRAKLSAIACPKKVKRLICIPVEEIEAWFWADPEIVKRVSNGKDKAVHEPERLSSPKEQLERASKVNGKARYSTNENPRYAKDLNLDLCAKRCPSFKELRDWLVSALPRSIQVR